MSSPSLPPRPFAEGQHTEALVRLAELAGARNPARAASMARSLAVHVTEAAESLAGPVARETVDQAPDASRLSQQS